MDLVRPQVACRREEPMRYICTSIVATLVLAGTSFAATINVPGDYATIQEAIYASDDGDQIYVADGVYTGSGGQVVRLNGKAIMLIGAVGGGSIIDGEGARRGITCELGETTDTIIANFTVINGSASFGGGAYVISSSPSILGCTFDGNYADYQGGGIWCAFSSAVIQGCAVTNNTVDVGGGTGGGIYSNSGSPVVSDTLVCGNTPDQIYGPWSDGGGNTQLESCVATGACCTLGDCFADQAEDDCVATGGDWMGEDTTCEPGLCSDVDGVLNVPSEYATIQSALDFALAGQTIQIAAGTYNEQFQVDKAVTVQGESIYTTILSGLNSNQIATVSSLGSDVAILKNLAFKNGHSDDGGALIIWNSAVEVRNCHFEDNIADEDGGAIAILGSESPLPPVLVYNCSFWTNTATSGGAISTEYAVADLRVEWCTFKDNSVTTNDSWGGGVCRIEMGTIHIENSSFINSSSSMEGGALKLGNEISSWPKVNGEILDCTFQGNSANTTGGAIWWFAGDTLSHIHNSTFDSNETGSRGGAVKIQWSGGWGNGDGGWTAPAIGWCDFTDNTAQGNGGAVHWENAPWDYHLRDCTFTGNQATGLGGAVLLESSPQVSVANCDFLGNMTEYAGSLYDSGGNALALLETNVTIGGTLMQGNTGSGGQGGAIRAYGSSMTLKDETRLIANSCDYQGGAIRGHGTAIDLLGVVISFNACTSSSGAIDSTGTVYANGSTFCSNDPGDGFIDTVIDCTFSEFCDDDCNGNYIPDETDIADGTSSDDDENGIPDECEVSCPGDFNGNGEITIDDVLFLIGAWGGADGDLNGDGTTTIDDLLIVLGVWGSCP